MWDPATPHPLIEELENQMPRLAQSVAARDFVVAAELITRRDELLQQLTEVQGMPADQKAYVKALCIEIQQQHELWREELTPLHTELADELKMFSARNKATQLYKNNR